MAAVNIPYHITQRGNARQFLLVTEEERAIYLDLPRKNIRPHELRLLGNCLMSNHRNTVMLGTVITWAVGSAIYAYLRAMHLIGSEATSPGYEKTLSFQMIAFCVSRLPILVLLLAVALWGEARFFRKP